MKTDISVVMATFNGEKYLEQQLHSILAQTHSPFEIIIGDDCSSDQTNSIISRFQNVAKFPIKLHNNSRRLGFRDNFLHACSRATGEWIAFCDQDDVWRRDKLEICASFGSDRRVTQIAHQANLIDDQGRLIGKFNQNISKSCLRPPIYYDIWSTFFGFSMVVRREVLQLIPEKSRYVDYIDPRFLIAHDRWAFSLAQTLGVTAEIAEPLVDYRQHSSNVFGAGEEAKSQTRVAIRDRHSAYVTATRHMLEIVSSLPEIAEANFPAFDRVRAEAVYRRALSQTEMRAKVYDSAGASAVFTCIATLARGGYRNAHNGSTRWRSILKDLSYGFKR